MLSRTVVSAVCGVVMTIGTGCTTMTSSSGSSTVLPSSAFFAVDPTELKPLQTIALAQDARMKSCHKGPACEEAYYLRGLVALFENRADAITVFQELRTTMPNNRYEAAITGWLNLLQDQAPASTYSKALVAQLKHEVLSDLLDHLELTAGRSGKDADRRVAELSR